MRSSATHLGVIPAKAGIHRAKHTGLWNMGPRFRGDDTICRALAGATAQSKSTHAGEAYLLPLIERLVEAHERGTDGGSGGAHGGETRAQELHAAGGRERGLGRAGAGELVGGSQR